MDITKSRSLSLSLSLSRADKTLLTIRQLSSIIHNTKMAEPYFQKISYSERLPKYKDFTPFEWEFKNSFSYEDYYGFSDLLIFKILTGYIICGMILVFLVTLHHFVMLSVRIGKDTGLFKDIFVVIFAFGIHVGVNRIRIIRPNPNI